MTAPLIIAFMGLACLLWAALLIDRARFRAYRKRRDEQANAAWWDKREGGQ